MRKNRADLYRKLVAVLLAVGGVAGFIVTVASEVGMLSRAGGGRSINAALMGLIALIFGASVWVGLDLWGKKPSTFRLAQVLLIAQIPILSLPGFSYQFYTGMTLYLLFDQAAALDFQFHLGSAVRLFSSGIEGFTFGINLVAVIALYLLGKTRPQNESVQAMTAGSI